MILIERQKLENVLRELLGKPVNFTFNIQKREHIFITGVTPVEVIAFDSVNELTEYASGIIRKHTRDYGRFLQLSHTFYNWVSLRILE